MGRPHCLTEEQQLEDELKSVQKRQADLKARRIQQQKDREAREAKEKRRAEIAAQWESAKACWQ